MLEITSSSCLLYQQLSLVFLLVSLALLPAFDICFRALLKEEL